MVSVEHLDVDGIRLVAPPAIYASEPAWRWKAEIPAYFNFWFLLKGRGGLICEGREYGLTPGSAFLFHPGQQVEAWHDPKDPIVNFAAHFQPLRRGRVMRSLSVFQLEGVIIPASFFMGDAARLAVKAASYGDRLGVRQAEGLIFQMMCHAWREMHMGPVPVRDRNILELVETMRSYPSQWRTVSEMARQAGMSPAHFSRRFRSLVGEPPNRWQARIRIDRARELLRHSPLTIGEVADALGYRDIYFFSRQFKRMTGTSPSMYRDASPALSS